MSQDFSHFSGVLHHVVLAKLTTSSIRVDDMILNCLYFQSTSTCSYTMIQMSAGTIVTYHSVKVSFCVVYKFYCLWYWTQPCCYTMDPDMHWDYSDVPHWEGKFLCCLLVLSIVYDVILFILIHPPRLRTSLAVTLMLVSHIRILRCDKVRINKS